jgi:phosphomannomutase
VTAALPPALLAQAEAWRATDPDPATRAELDALVATADLEALRERFAAPLEFGTAGLRGLIGCGPGRMNVATVTQAAAAVARQLLEDVPEAATRGVAVGRDARRMSDVFARVAAEVIAAHGVVVHWLPQAAPTPVVAFVGRHRGAAGVAIVTASHNPPEYNGFKVYGPSASQIVPPQDARIRDHRDAITDPSAVPRMPFAEAVRAGLIRVVGEADFRAYLEALDAQCLLQVPPPAQVDVVTTALHGVGHAWVSEALTRRGHQRLHPVYAQAHPDGAFPTVRFPNPEEKGALDMATALADERAADLILANDPDTDRLAVSVREPASRRFRQLTGNEVGLLLADWIFTEGPKRAGWPVRPLALCSLVSTMMLEPLATAHGVASAEVLTGFKWIWDEALKREASRGETYVFGFEEALGYCVGRAVRDKDGVGAAQVLMELASHEAAAGRTLLDRLDDIARRIGVSVTDQVTAVLPGLDGLARIGRVMATWRALGASGPFGGGLPAVTRMRDLDPPGDGLPEGVPVRSNVLTWWLADGSRVIARPSGTEPKLKVYLEARAEVSGDGSAGLAQARAEATARVEALKIAIQKAIDAVA